MPHRYIGRAKGRSVRKTVSALSEGKTAALAKNFYLFEITVFLFKNKKKVRRVKKIAPKPLHVSRGSGINFLRVEIRNRFVKNCTDKRAKERKVFTMKKLATLLLAAGLVFGAATGASAIDFKAKGQWIMSFDYGQGGNFVERGRSNNGVKGNKTSGYSNKEDEFEARQRVRLQLDAVASESLSGTVYFEIGDQIWGKDSTGGALGSDGKVVELKRAYIDWIVPNTDLKVRMGLQGISLPAFTTQASQILDDDMAGIVLSNKFNDNVTLTAFWARPYNDNYPGSDGYLDNGKWNSSTPANYMDNVDLFSLLLPMSFDGVKVTPWAMLGFFGPNAFREGWNGEKYVSGSYGNAYGRFSNGTRPAVWTNKNYKKGYNEDYATGFWAGITGEVTMWDPFRLAWDLNYGGIYNDQEALNRGGFYGSLLGEYKLDWGTPGLYFWYSTGDNNNPKDGSERMATLSANGNNQFSNFAGNGNPYIAREGVLGSTLVGTWGVGGRVKDVSFVEGLKHTLRVNYFGGTNSPAMAKYITGKKDVGGTGVNWWQYRNHRPVGDFNQNDGLYLTTMDSALEFGLTSDYKIHDNLTFSVDAAYIALWLDQSKSVWGGGWIAGTNQTSWLGSNSITDAWNINASFVYDF